MHSDAIAVVNQAPQGLCQNGSAVLTDLMDPYTAVSMAVPMADVAWSPALADEIGWDWGDFSQLFTEAPI